MQKIIYNSWNLIMDHNINPLKNIPSTKSRHMIMQILAWMWCIVFSMYFGSIWVFGITTISHFLIIGAIAMTVLSFENAKKNSINFSGYFTPSRSRAIYVDGKRIELDPNDKGGEHE